MLPDVWSLPDGDIPFDQTVYVNIDDPESPGKIAQISVQFDSEENILYFDEKPFALYSIGRLTLRCKVTKVTKTGDTIIMTGKALIGKGSSEWQRKQMQDLCTKIRDPNFEKYDFPLDSSIGEQIGRIVPYKSEVENE